MYSSLGTGFLFLLIGQLCSSASISITTELPQPSYRSVVNRFHKVFLDFPCSNKVIVNQMFDIFNKFGTIEQDENAFVDAATETKRLVVIGSNMNVSPKAWKTAQQNYESNAAATLDSFANELHLTPAQIERLHIIYPESQLNGEQQMYLDNFQFGIALGVPEADIKRILDENERAVTDYDSRNVISKKAAEDLGAFAERMCERNYINPGQYTKKVNVVRDFLQAISDIKLDDSK